LICVVGALCFLFISTPNKLTLNRTQTCFHSEKFSMLSLWVSFGIIGDKINAIKPTHRPTQPHINNWLLGRLISSRIRPVCTHEQFRQLCNLLKRFSVKIFYIFLTHKVCWMQSLEAVSSSKMLYSSWGGGSGSWGSGEGDAIG